jgi:hypothetical protein
MEILKSSKCFYVVPTKGLHIEQKKIAKFYLI